MIFAASSFLLWSASAHLGASGGATTAPASAAELAWEARVDATDEEARLRHAQEFLLEFAHTAAPDAVAIAHATIGGILWRRACPIEGLLGACVEWRASRTASCASEPGRWVVRRRDPMLARDGRAALAQALALTEAATAVAGTGQRRDELDAALAAAGRDAASFAAEAALVRPLPAPISMRVTEWHADLGEPFTRKLVRQREDRSRSERLIAAHIERTRELVAAPAFTPTTRLAAARAAMVLLADRQALLGADVALRRLEPRPGRDVPVSDDIAADVCVRLVEVTDELRDDARAMLERCAAPAPGEDADAEAIAFCRAASVLLDGRADAQQREFPGGLAQRAVRMERFGVQTVPRGAAVAEAITVEHGAGGASPPAPPTDPGVTAPTAVHAWPNRRTMARSKRLGVEVTGTLDADVVARIVAAHRGELLWCRDRGRGSPRRASLRLVIGDDGRIRASEATAAERSVAACLQQRSRQWWFPGARPSDQGGAVRPLSVVVIHVAP